MHVGFKSDRGVVRPTNEDACFVLLPDKVYVLADGVGGGNSGEIASRTAVTEIANYVVDHPISRMDNKYEIVDYLKRAIDRANTKIFEKAVSFRENSGMATTTIVVYVRKGKAYIANVGDSRVYLYREGEFAQLTEDHTYVNTLVKAGILTRDEADRDERKNVIIRALGADTTVEPDFFQVDLKVDDVLICCSDGLYDELTSEEIVEVIERCESMSELAKQLIERANEHGGRDNITIISLKVTEEDINE